MHSKGWVLSMGVAIAVVAAGGQAQAQADSTTDSLGPRAVALGEALQAAAAGATSIQLNPAGLALTRGFVLEGSFGVRGVDDARTAAASVCDSTTSRVAACLYYDYFTASPTGGSRTQHEVGLTTAIPLANTVYLGLTNRYVSYTDTVSGADHSGFGMDAGAIIKVLPTLNVAAVGYNLVGNDKANFPIGAGTAIALFATPQLMIAGDARWNMETKKGRFGGGIEYFLTPQGAQQGYPLRGGYVYDELSGASFATAGLGYITPSVAIDAGMRRQISKGDEMMLQFGLRLFLPD